MQSRNFRRMLEERWAGGKFVCVGLDSGDFQKMAKVIDTTHDLVCAYKPNTEFYLSSGPTGLEALRAVILHINDAAPFIPVILDRKAGDIGNTNDGTAELAFEYLNADAITVSPYLGGEALRPFLDRADKGVFVLCRTSNQGAGEFQDVEVCRTFDQLVELVGGNADEANDLSGKLSWSYPTGGYRVPFYQYVALRVSRRWNKNQNCGLVVGATYPGELGVVRRLAGDIPILIPGIGAQGGDLEKTVSAGKDSRGKGIIINSSRGIIFADDPRAETQKLHDAIYQKVFA